MIGGQRRIPQVNLPNGLKASTSGERRMMTDAVEFFTASRSSSRGSLQAMPVPGGSGNVVSAQS